MLPGDEEYPKEPFVGKKGKRKMKERGSKRKKGSKKKEGRKRRERKRRREKRDKKRKGKVPSAAVCASNSFQRHRSAVEINYLKKYEV